MPNKDYTLRSCKQRESPKVEYTNIWTDCEKEILLSLLSEHGDSDLEVLAAGLPNKHAMQVKTYLRTISRRAAKLEETSSNSNENVQYQQQRMNNLEEWIKELKKIYSNEPSDDTVPFELFVQAKKTGLFQFPDVDFQKAYEYLFALMCGRHIEVDDETLYFVHCYADCFSKQFDKYLLTNESALLSVVSRKISKNVDFKTKKIEIFEDLCEKYLDFEEELNYNKFLDVLNSIRVRNSQGKHEEDDSGNENSDMEVDLESILVSEGDESISLNPFIKEKLLVNLPSYLWAAMFNFNISELYEKEHYGDQIIKREVVGSL